MRVPHSAIPRAFTLIELMVVIGIIAIMLVALIPAVNSLSKASGRKAAIASLLGALEQARANAIKTGNASYVVFPAFTAAAQDTLDRYQYKAFAVFEDDPGAPTSLKQLTKWQTLPTGVAFRAAPGAAGSVTDLPVAPGTFTFTPETNATADYYCLKFNANGELESPLSSTEITVFEGHVSDATATEIVTGAKEANGDPKARESVKIARLTGRAERAP